MGVLGSLNQLVSVLRENYAPMVAGSLAFSAFVSILPLLTLALVVGTAVGGERLVDQALRFTNQYLTPGARDLFAEALQNRSGQTAASLLSVVLLVWSGLRVFRTLDSAFSLFYDTPGSTSLLERIRDALLVLVVLAAALVASTAVALVSAVTSLVPMGWLFGPLLLVVPLAVVLLPVYYVFPDADVSVREVIPGVLVVAVGWAVLQGLFQLYTEYAGQYEVYGTIGGVLLVLTWLYLAAFLLLVGVAVNVVVAGRTGAALSRPPARTNAAAER